MLKEREKSFQKDHLKVFCFGDFFNEKSMGLETKIELKSDRGVPRILKHYSFTREEMP